MNKKSKVLVILGPTSSGKTKLGVALAKKFNGEIISADSRQVYRGMDIGTGKDLKEYGKILHHCIDIASPKTNFTVEQWQRHAHKVINDILRRGKVPIVVGGTGLYISALVDGYQFPAPASKKQQTEVRKKLDKKTLPALLTELKEKDLDTYKIIDKKNRRRVQRALEIYYLSGTPKSQLIKKNPPPYEFLQLGVTFPKKDLEKLILTRLRTRLKQGMVAEVKRLRKTGVSWKRLEELGLEYRWLTWLVRDNMSRKEFEEGLVRAIYQFAKRQMTWFKRDERIYWVRSSLDAEQKIKAFLAS